MAEQQLGIGFVRMHPIWQPRINQFSSYVTCISVILPEGIAYYTKYDFILELHPPQNTSCVSR